MNLSRSLVTGLLLTTWLAPGVYSQRSSAARDYPIIDMHLHAMRAASYGPPQTGSVRVLAEVTTQYRGLAPNAPELDPYWSVAEEFDVPVGIHMGSGPPGSPMMGARTYRAATGRPLLLEEMLVRHPRLRVYVMHAGYPYADELISLMLLYPQVHADVGVIAWATPRPAFHQFLRRLVDAGLVQRVMFGSDQMVWPEAITRRSRQSRQPTS